MIKKTTILTLLCFLSIYAYSQSINIIEVKDKWKGFIRNSKNEWLKYYEPETFERTFERNGTFTYEGKTISTKGIKISYTLITSRKGCYFVEILGSFENYLKVNNKTILSYSDFRIYNNFTNILISLDEDSKVTINSINPDGIPTIKFINLRKLNQITNNSPYIIYSDSEDNKLIGSALPKTNLVSGIKRLICKIKSYKWEMKDINGSWINAPGIKYKKDYLLQDLSCINNEETKYQFRRTVKYEQTYTNNTRAYEDNTATITVIVKPRLSPALTCETPICEDDSSIKLKLIGCLPNCNPDEEYNITISDGTNDFVFESILSNSFITLDYNEAGSKIYKLKRISNKSGTQSIEYKAGEEPSLSVSKHETIHTKQIQESK